MREPENQLINKAKLFVFRCLIEFFSHGGGVAMMRAACSSSWIGAGFDKNDAVVNSFDAERGKERDGLVLRGEAKNLTQMVQRVAQIFTTGKRREMVEWVTTWTFKKRRVGAESGDMWKNAKVNTHPNIILNQKTRQKLECNREQMMRVSLGCFT